MKAHVAKHGTKGKAPLVRTDITSHGYFTRYVKLVVTPDNLAETSVGVLLDAWISQFDMAEVAASVKGPRFTAAVFEATCQELASSLHVQLPSMRSPKNKLNSKINFLET